MNPSKRLSRRAMLQGMGTAIALPFLDAMSPAFAASAPSPTRMAFLYVPNGIVMNEWTPQGQAAGVAALPEELPRITRAARALSQRLHDAQRLDVEWRPRAGRRSRAITDAPAPRISPAFIPRRRTARIYTPAFRWTRWRRKSWKARPASLRSSWAAKKECRAVIATTVIAARIATAFRGGRRVADAAGNPAARGIRTAVRSDGR